MTPKLTLNEEEVREAVYAKAIAKGVKMNGQDVTKTIIDDILDIKTDVAIEAIASGKGVKEQGLGSLVIKDHIARPYKTPILDDAGQPTGETLEGITPAGKHVKFEVSEELFDALNA